MAIRANASTGVTIALIVFVILTVLLLAGGILLYGQLNTAKENEAKAVEAMEEYVQRREQNAPWFDALKNASGRDSMLGHLHGRYVELQQFALGAASDALPDLEEARVEMGLDATGSLAAAFSDLTRQNAEFQSSLNALQSRVKSAENDRDGLKADLQAALNERDALIAAESEQLQPYADADARYAAAIKKAVNDFEQMQTSSRDQKDATIADLNSDLDKIRADNRRITTRLRDMESRLNRDRVGSADPASLVDGRGLEVVGDGDMLYIDRGRKDQVVLGMTFEVYDSPEQIKADLDGGEDRGKASVQIIKVGDSSATAKVTRSTPGRPVLPGNLLANALYDPTYRFKFLVHGMFDLDGDGNPSAQEAEYLRDRIRRWGGHVVQGDDIPGDLDFLVLGEAPRKPLQPGIDQRSTQAMEAYRERRTAYDLYLTLFEQAQEAGIPVLNQNRLSILTGRTDF